MKITVRNAESKRGIHPKDVSIGTLFRPVNAKEDCYLRVINGWVNLRDSFTTPSSDARFWPAAYEILPRGTVVTLENE